MQNYIQIAIRLIVLAAVCVTIYWLGSTLGSVLFPVIVSIILAYLLDPVIRRLQKLGIPRAFGIIILLLLGLSLLVLFATFFYPVIRTQILTLSDRLPALVSTVQTKILPWLKEVGVEVPESLTGLLTQYGDNLKSAIPSVLNHLGSWVPGAITTTGAIVSSFLNVVLIPLFTFYFARDLDKIRENLATLIPTNRRDYVFSRLRAIDDVVGTWFRGQLQVASILAILYSSGFGLVFYLSGMDATTGIVVGILTGCLSVIPYVGAITGSVLSILLALIDWHGFWPFAGIAIVFTIVQVTEGYVLTPRIVGEKLGLSPATVMIALLVAGTLAGLPGMLFALPITGALKILAKDAINAYKTSHLFADPVAVTPRKQTRKRKKS